MSECGTHQNCTGAHRPVPAALCETLIPRVVLYKSEAFIWTSSTFPQRKTDKAMRDCGRYRHRCRAWHQKQRQSGTEMPKFCLGNYAFFGVGEPAACGAGVVTVPFAVVACCNAFPRPQRDDAERGEGATQPDADTPLSCDVCAWLWYCVITSSAIPHGYTP